MSTCGVYALIGLAGRYVGASTQIEKRWEHHRGTIRRGTARHSLRMPEFAILELCAAKEHRSHAHKEALNALEQKWMDATPPGRLLNIYKKGGSGCSGEVLRKLWEDPAYRDLQHTSKVAAWSDPKTRTQMLAARRTPEARKNHADSMARRDSNPANTERRRIGVLKSLEDPRVVENRLAANLKANAKRSETLKATWARRKAAAA